MPKCGNCEGESEEMKTCSRCKLARYCSQECQREHWAAHKVVCQKPPEAFRAPNVADSAAAAAAGAAAAAMKPKPGEPWEILVAAACLRPRPLQPPTHEWDH